MFGQLITSVGDRLINFGKHLKQVANYRNPPIEVEIRQCKHNRKLTYFGFYTDRNGKRQSEYLSRDRTKAEEKARDLSAELSGFL